MKKDAAAVALGRKRWAKFSKQEKVRHMTELSKKAAKVRTEKAQAKKLSELSA